MKKIYIYSLIDPLTNIVRYIGKTVNIERRLANHIGEAKYTKNNNHKNNWIRSLLNQNLKPILQILEETTEDLWEEREKYYIKTYREIVDLTNAAEGGNSNSGFKHKPETILLFKQRRKTFLGKHHTDETKKLLSLQRIGKNIGSENPFYGKTHSDETKEKLRIYRLGKTWEGYDTKKFGRSGKLNHFSNHYILTSPQGIIYEVTGGIKKFCAEHKLSYPLIRKSVNVGIIQTPTDVRIDAVSHLINNTIGWEVKLIHSGLNSTKV